jgi:hypothetical protein
MAATSDRLENAPPYNQGARDSATAARHLSHTPPGFELAKCLSRCHEDLCERTCNA